MLPGIAGRGERPTTLTSALASKRVRFTRFRLLLTAKLTAKPADGDGRLCTVTARSLELEGVVDIGVRAQTLLTSMTRRGSGVQVPHGPPR